MIRLFEYLRTLDGDIERPPAGKPSPSNRAQRPDDACQVLSVLHLPQSAREGAPEVTNFRVAEVDVQPEDRLVCHTEPGSPAAHRFRLMRVRLREMQKARSIRTLLVTSALPQDGKSTVVMNVATTLRQQGQQSILVIDGDLHRFSLTQRFSAGNAGLAECINSGLDPCAAIQRLEPLGWHLLPAGAPSKNASELLYGDAVSGIIRKLSSVFDWILIDSPPVAPLADAVSLARNVDATLFVMRADCTPGEAVQHAISIIGRERVIGIVLNGIREADRLYHRYSGYYRDAEMKKQPAERQTNTPAHLGI